MSDPITILIIASTFLLAGLVKGVIGMGIPTVSLALLTAMLGLPQAMALLLVPAIVTNLWQGFAGGASAVLLKRLWPFLTIVIVTVWIGALALTRVSFDWLSLLLGSSLIAYALANLSGFRLSLSSRNERVSGLGIGAINGLLTGMTGSSIPGVIYLQAIGLPREMLVQAMGILFSLSTVALALAMGGNGFLTVEIGALSAAALIPALIGMFVGSNIRQRLSEKMFRTVFFLGLLLMGLTIIAQSVSGMV